MRSRDLYCFLRSKQVYGFSDLETLNTDIGNCGGDSRLTPTRPDLTPPVRWAAAAPGCAGSPGAIQGEPPGLASWGVAEGTDVVTYVETIK